MAFKLSIVAAAIAPVPAVMMMQEMIMRILTWPLKMEISALKIMEPPMMQKPTGKEPIPTRTATGRQKGNLVLQATMLLDLRSVIAVDPV